MKDKSRFWPLDDFSEEEIYENPSWDLPGLILTRKSPLGRTHKRKST